MGQKQIRTGSPVSWNWGNGTAEGKVTEIHREKITRKIKGNEVTRDGIVVQSYLRTALFNCS